MHAMEINHLSLIQNIIQLAMQSLANSSKLQAPSVWRWPGTAVCRRLVSCTHIHPHWALLSTPSPLGEEGNANNMECIPLNTLFPLLKYSVHKPFLARRAFLWIDPHTCPSPSHSVPSERTPGLPAASGNTHTPYLQSTSCRHTTQGRNTTVTSISIPVLMLGMCSYRLQ